MEKIPGKVAQIEWNDDDHGRVADLVVFNRTEMTPRQMDKFGDRYAASHGACVGDWMTGTRARSTPEGQFIARVLDGFVDADTMLSVLDQFSQIDEAEWARTMATALREELRNRFSGDPEEAAHRYPDPWQSAEA